jgi:hypothetical protein
MKSKITTVNEYDEIDIYGSEDGYSIIIDTLFYHDDSYESMQQAYLKTFELVRRHVWRNYGEKVYLEHEDAIKHELFFMLAEYIEFSANDRLMHIREYNDMGTREFLEMLLNPFKTLDWLFENYVDVSRVIPNDLLSGDSLLH